MDIILGSMFGSEAGGWSYPYVRPVTAATFLIALVLIPILVVLAYFSSKQIRRHEWMIVLAWLLVGFAAQIWMRSLAPYNMSEIIQSPGATSFYTVTQEHSAWDFVTHFHALVGSLPLHARANMPGKTLLFYLLETMTRSTQVMGYLIILISNLGGLLTYYLTRQWYQSPLAALYALIFYLFMPAKLYFFPILNTVTPVPMLLSLLLFVMYLTSKKDRYLPAVGITLYGLFIFEPLPFVTGLIFLALMGKCLLDGELTRSGVMKIFSYVPATFFLLHFILAATLGFDVFKAFSFALKDAYTFNAETHRPYAVWLIHNLKDFFLNMGIAQTLLYFICLGSTLWKLALLIRLRTGTGQHLAALLHEEQRAAAGFYQRPLDPGCDGHQSRRNDPSVDFPGRVLANGRGALCAVGLPFRVFAVVLALTIVQTTFCLTRVGFVIP